MPICTRTAIHLIGSIVSLGSRAALLLGRGGGIRTAEGRDRGGGGLRRREGRRGALRESGIGPNEACRVGADHLRSLAGLLWQAAAGLLRGGPRPHSDRSPGAGL